MADFTMPALGADMETGQVVEWLVAPGARVKPGDIVAVVETHKGAIDVECFLDGVIEDLAPTGQDLPVGALLAHVRSDSEAPATGAGPAAPVPVDPVAGAAEAPAGAGVAASTWHPTRPAAAAAPPPAAIARSEAIAPPAALAQRVKVSPAARRRAQALGLDAEALVGTGVEGAVSLADVDLAAAQPGVTALHRAANTPAVARATPPPAAGRGGFDPAQMRRAIAAAMGRSKREIPHYYLSTTVDFAAASRWLAGYNGEREPAERLLPACLLLKAAARALVEVPQLNGHYENDAFRPGAGIHPGWAVALRGGGLVAPAIHHADRQALPELMRALRDLVQRARAGGLRSSELMDPTVTVTSLGDRGAESVWGVIYPPQVAIIGFGRVVLRPWVVDAQVVARPLVVVTLAADHRASDGHLGGQVLAAIEHALQSPELL